MEIGQRGEALVKAEALIAAAKIQGDWDGATATHALAYSLTEDRALWLVKTLLSPCLAARCQAFDPQRGSPPSIDEIIKGPGADTPHTRAASTLVGLLGELGTSRSLPLLLQLGARGNYGARMASERILTRAMVASQKKYPCKPPSAEEVSAARKSLAGFVGIRRRGGRLVAELPTRVELDDLAYFFAAVKGAGPEVGQGQEQGQGGHFRPGPVNRKRKQLVEMLEAAKMRGEIAEVARLGRAFLGTLGYPGPVRTDEEHEYAWGGPRHAYVMRDLAFAAEALGQFNEAAHLYRRANPGGGACGTTASLRWAWQVQGTIRAEERLGRCRAVIPERLIDVDGSESGPYGPGRLRAAGFDVLRLYRGALVTLNRDLEPGDVGHALASISSEKLRRQATERLKRMGPETWERRVYAIEGLADIAQRRALRPLLDAAAVASTDTKTRALDALGELARKSDYDPCDASTVGGFDSISTSWSRRIRPLGRSCKVMLSAAESRKLAVKVMAYLGDSDSEVRAAAARALGAIASPVAQLALRRLLSDPYHHPPGVCTKQRGSSRGSCHPFFPVRAAAEEALQRIRELATETSRSVR